MQLLCYSAIILQLGSSSYFESYSRSWLCCCDYFNENTNTNDSMQIEIDNSILPEVIIITLFFTTVFSTGDYLAKCYQCIIRNKNVSLVKTIVPVLLCSIYLAIIISIVMNLKCLYNIFEKLNTLICLPWILLAWMFSRIISFTKQNENDSLDINSMQGLDYGSGMAHSYYQGYLRLILPSLGTDNKGLLEKIENTEDSHKISIAVHKLLILIPSSSYIPPDLKEASYQWMESAIDLEPEIRDRAGIKRRPYHNNVYKIYPDGKKSNSVPVYVVAEGATPVLTFFEAQRFAHRHTDAYRKYCKLIIRSLYDTLKELLDNDPECKDLCELIYYHDCDSNGAKVNVAKVILERLSKIS